MQCVNMSYHNNFLISLEMNDEAVIDSTKYKSEHFSVSEQPSNPKVWILRAELNKKGGFYCEKTQQNSMWLHNEIVLTVVEYASNKMLLSIDPELMVVEKWEPLRIIQNKFTGNTEK